MEDHTQGWRVVSAPDQDGRRRAGPAAVPALRRAQVLARYPHLGRGFTQGLLSDGSTVWESTGQYGISALRRYRLGAERDEECGTGPAGAIRRGHLPRPAAACGSSPCREGRRTALAARPADPAGDRSPYDREGWGICDADDCVVTSDGSSELVRRDPATLQPLGTVVGATAAAARVTGLNDLAWSGGLVWANVMPRPYLAGIDLATGDIVEAVDARPAAERHWGAPQAVMNGIAALPAPAEFLLTGKAWRPDLSRPAGRGPVPQGPPAPAHGLTVGPPG